MNRMHGNARVPFAVVELIRELHECGVVGYKLLARVFRVSITQVRRYVEYSQRVSR